MKSFILFSTLLLVTINGFCDEIGVASFYGGKFHGRKMANGKVFNKYKISAAHKRIPLGSIIKITNLKNKKHILCEVSDRGPYIKGRILDISLAARNALDFDGLTKVSIKIVKKHS